MTLHPNQMLLLVFQVGKFQIALKDTPNAFQGQDTSV